MGLQNGAHMPTCAGASNQESFLSLSASATVQYEVSRNGATGRGMQRRMAPTKRPDRTATTRVTPAPAIWYPGWFTPRGYWALCHMDAMATQTVPKRAGMPCRLWTPQLSWRPVHWIFGRKLRVLIVQSYVIDVGNFHKVLLFRRTNFFLKEFLKKIEAKATHSSCTETNRHWPRRTQVHVGGCTHCDTTCYCFWFKSGKVFVSAYRSALHCHAKTVISMRILVRVAFWMSTVLTLACRSAGVRPCVCTTAWHRPLYWPCWVGAKRQRSSSKMHTERARYWRWYTAACWLPRLRLRRWKMAYKDMR